MSTADYIAKFSRRKAQRDTVVKYWTEEARRELRESLDLELRLTRVQDLPEVSIRP